MAWNSTYESRAGLFTLTFVSPQDSKKTFDYTFTAAVSFTQERNLTDTLNKFSLDIVDDGSEDFHGLENIILSGITGIRMTYGVGTDNQISWSGFVYDYSSTFFGQKVKLTLIGYITLSHDNLNDYAGHYYRLDWSPMIPYRNDYSREWDLFQTSDYVWQRDGNDVEITKITKEDFLDSYKDAYNEAVESDAKYLNDTAFILDFARSSEDLEGAFKAYIESNKKINKQVYWSILGLWQPYTMKWVDENGYITSSWRAYRELQEAEKRYQLYESLYNSYFNRYKKGNFAVDFDITKLKNAVFSPFPSNFSSDRQILIPVPDLFIQWDGILPEATYQDKKWKINYDSLLGTLNDVTAFGLTCELVPGTYSDSDENTKPKVALKGVQDQYLNTRILKMNNATFICVSDAKALAEYRWGKFTGEADFTEAISSSSTASTTTKATMSDNASKVCTYFKDRGYSDAAIAGILGNLYCESGIVLNKKEGGSTCTFEEACASYRESGKDFGWGLMQWTPPTKIEYNANGTTFYQKVSGDRNTIETQCILIEKALEHDFNSPEFMRSYYQSRAEEYNNANPDNKISFSYPEDYVVTKENFKTCTDVQKTSRAFHLCVERPKVVNATTDKQQSRAKTCSTYLNAIQGFEASENEAKIADNTVVPKSWYRTYYNYCLSAYRSALPLQYGGVYISDIVEKLCKIEGWSCEVTPTTWTSYEAIQDSLIMDGRNALDYIVNVLAPLATSENGYTGYIVKLENNHLTFQPAVPDRLGTLEIRMGYNIPDSPVLSFSCKTRGTFIMHGVAEEVSTVTNYSNESAVLQTYTKAESFIESKFASKSTTQGSNWFSKGLFSYYGFLNNLEGYNSFFTTFYGDDFYYGENNVDKKKSFSFSINDFQGNKVNASLSTSLIRSTPYSSLGDLSGAKVLNDLSRFEETSIKAEINIIGDNRIIPNSYIEVINMTRRGRHYTSGIYWINKMTDSFSKGTWTQKLECNRYDSNVDFFNRTTDSVINQVDSSMSELIDAVINNNITVEQVDQKLKDYQEGKA